MDFVQNTKSQSLQDQGTVRIAGSIMHLAPAVSQSLQDQGTVRMYISVASVMGESQSLQDQGTVRI